MHEANQDKKLVGMLLKEFGGKGEVKEKDIKSWFAEVNPTSEVTGKYLIALALGAGINIKLRTGQNIQPRKLSEKKITEVSKQEIENLLTQYPKSKVCEMFNCSYKTLLKMCEAKGSTAAEKTRDTKFAIPTKEDLLKNYMKYGTISKLASFYDIADCTMARWLKERGINKHKKDNELKKKIKAEKLLAMGKKENIGG